MLSVGCLFIISEQADRKIVNRVLVHLGFLGIGGADYGDSFEIITTRDPLGQGEEPDSPPLQTFDNKWAGKSVADTEQFMIDQLTMKEQRTNIIYRDLCNYLVLDDQGIREKTIILLSRDQNWDEEDACCIFFKTFKKSRIPWDFASLSWSNLNLGNQEFFECVGSEWTPEHDGWTPYRGLYHVNADREKIDAAIAQLESTGDA